MDTQDTDAPTGRWERAWAYLVSVAVITAAALPGARTLLDDTSADGFPLSTYPMFVNDKGRSVSQATVVTVGADVSEPIGPEDPVERLSPAQIARTDQVLQASVTVRDQVRAGRSQALCTDIAARLTEPATLVVVTEEFDSMAWADDTTTDPIRRTEHARCEATGR